MDLPSEYGSLAEYFHTATRNLSLTKRIFIGHQIHYTPEVRQLVSDSPQQYRDAPTVDLPDIIERKTVTLEESIRSRGSQRDFSPLPLRSEDLSHILYHSCAVKKTFDAGPNGIKSYKRNYPNSGNLGSVEVYPIVLNVKGIAPGIYHFNTVQHKLSLLREGNFRQWLHHHVFYQVEYRQAAVVLVLAASFGRLMEKYGERGYRLGYLDTGHVSQNIYLLASGLGLGVCASAGFIDEELDRALMLDGLNEATALTLLLGNPVEPAETNSEER